MKMAYLAGKYTDPRGPHFQLQWCEQARQVAAALWSLGIAVIAPHMNTLLLDGASDYETFMQGDLIMVERSDLIVMLDTWVISSGAMREREHADIKGVIIFYWISDLESIIRFCHPQGLPAEYLVKAKHTLTEKQYAIAAGCCNERQPSAGQ